MIQSDESLIPVFLAMLGILNDYNHPENDIGDTAYDSGSACLSSLDRANPEHSVAIGWLPRFLPEQCAMVVIDARARQS